MAKNIEISTVSRRAVHALLPLGWKQEVAKILQEEGKEYHPNTLTNAFKADAKLTPANIDVWNAAVEYLERLKAKARPIKGDLVKDVQSYKMTGS